MLLVRWFCCRHSALLPTLSLLWHAVTMSVSGYCPTFRCPLVATQAAQVKGFIAAGRLRAGTVPAAPAPAAPIPVFILCQLCRQDATDFHTNSLAMFETDKLCAGDHKYCLVCWRRFLQEGVRTGVLAVVMHMDYHNLSVDAPCDKTMQP